MKKVLFIDRDGTLIHEPEDFQIDSFEKLSFLPGVFYWLAKIVRELDFELVMVTNQDGLGTGSFPETNFWPVHNFILNTLESEGILFADVHIDRTFEYENAPTRKPNTGMLTKYLNGSYNLSGSFVVGDRLTDVQLAKNIGAKAIFLNASEDDHGLAETISLKSKSWEEIYNFLKLPARKISHQRITSETSVSVELNLDGNGKSDISTGIPFFDHMLEQVAKHGNLDLILRAKGDLQIDEHHTIEDTAITLGETFLKALANKKGIERYGFVLPMDDCLAQVAIDFGGRNWLVWNAEFKREKLGDMPTEMFFHFFKSFSDASKSNLNIKVYGKNEHHKIEAIFKAFGKCIKQAVWRDKNNMNLPSTKGIL